MAATLVAAGGRAATEAMTAHCRVAAAIAARLGLGPEVQQPLLHVFSRWDGKGMPKGARRGAAAGDPPGAHRDDPAGPAGGQGEKGDRGPVGANGEQGAPGPAGVSGFQYIAKRADTDILKDKYLRWSVDCPNGKNALGGGVSTTAPYETRVIESAPTGEAIGWGVGVKNEGGPTMAAYVWVTCAYVG